MEIIIQKDADTASLLAARVVANVIRQKPNAVLGLATGSSPIRFYRHLIKMYVTGEVDFKNVTTFNLDEYVGLPPSHNSSYASFMHNQFFKHVNIKEKNINIPDGLASDIPLFCLNYEKKIRQLGGIDVQILGIGSDGHIGFNEPTSSLASRTRIKTLTKQTIEDNAQFFGPNEPVPHHVITMGIGTILDSSSCILLAFGEKKANALAKAVEGPITSMVPASALQLHRDAKAFLDEGSASKFLRSEY